MLSAPLRLVRLWWAQALVRSGPGRKIRFRPRRNREKVAIQAPILMHAISESKTQNKKQRRRKEEEEGGERRRRRRRRRKRRRRRRTHAPTHPGLSLLCPALALACLPWLGSWSVSARGGAPLALACLCCVRLWPVSGGSGWAGSWSVSAGGDAIAVAPAARHTQQEEKEKSMKKMRRKSPMKKPVKKKVKRKSTKSMKKAASLKQEEKEKSMKKMRKKSPMKHGEGFKKAPMKKR